MRLRYAAKPQLVPYPAGSSRAPSRRLCTPLQAKGGAPLKANLKHIVEDIKQAAATSEYDDHSSSGHSGIQGAHTDNNEFLRKQLPALNAVDGEKQVEQVLQSFAELERQIVLEKLRKRGGAASSAAPRHIKQYPPVSKGDLLLPGGPNWSAFRRHICYNETPCVPKIHAILAVEGDNDYAAVSRAVSIPAYVFHGTRINTEVANVEVAALKALGRPIIAMTDPDAAGRKFRLHLDDSLGPLYHAFLPEALAVTIDGTMSKDAGNRGLEHAQPETICDALSRVLLSYGAHRHEFTREELQRLQLLNDEHTRVANVELRRRLLCALLGLGDCSGGALQTMLNRFISREQLMDTLAKTDRRMAAMGSQLGGVTLLKADDGDGRLLQALA